MDGRSSSGRVSPFRYLRIRAYLQLPAAFRSLSRLSSALSAKASSLRSFLLNLTESATGMASSYADSVPRSGISNVSDTNLSIHIPRMSLSFMVT